MSFDIRPFAPGDLPRLHAIREAAFAPVFASFRSITGDVASAAFPNAEREQAQHLDDLCGEANPATVLVVIQGGKIIGFVAYTIDTETGLGEIGLNAVHPDHAGQGIGTCLYEMVLERMRQVGARAATVSTGGDPSHAAARRAYEKVGFGSPIPAVSFYRAL